MSTNIEDKRLQLSDGRILAYADNGDPTSSCVILWFNGVFGVGDAENPPRVLMNQNAHWISPSLPGWGATSPVVSVADYASILARDITALLNLLHPDTASIRLYISGGSFGTVAAQILYCAPYFIFPPGRQITGMLLAAPFSPFHAHVDYASTLSWSTYMSVGPPVKHIPFRLHMRLSKLVLDNKTRNNEDATKFIQNLLFDKMGAGERAELARWTSEQVLPDGTVGLPNGELQRRMGKNVARSVAHSWEGFLSTTDVLHGGWGGADPRRLDEEHAKSPVLVVASAGDSMSGDGMARWLVDNYKHGKLKQIQGGHIAGLFQFEQIWTEFMSLCQ